MHISHVQQFSNFFPRQLHFALFAGIAVVQFTAIPFIARFTL